MAVRFKWNRWSRKSKSIGYPTTINIYGEVSNSTIGFIRMSSTANGLSTIKILGTRVHMAHISDVVESMDCWIQTEPDRHHHVINTGLHGIMEAYRSPQIKKIFNSADLLAPDGILTILVLLQYTQSYAQLLLQCQTILASHRT